MEKEKKQKKIQQNKNQKKIQPNTFNQTRVKWLPRLMPMQFPVGVRGVSFVLEENIKSAEKYEGYYN